MAKKEKETKQPENEAVENEAAEAEQTVEAEKEPTALEKAEQLLKEANDKFLRTLAEYDNFRKRSQKEKEAAFGDSKASVLAELLPVMDNFERAVSNKDASLEDYQKGIDMIFGQFNDIFAKLGVEAFGEKGDEFDPNIHNAVMHIEDENEKENTVVDVFSKGYRLGDRILRPAMVKVAN
ncbi:MAG: nucleotide exchange factor GrpE [Clostridia bacterium]|nr:nucleotide exchange factor GrpE [Clostridia bacterium]